MNKKQLMISISIVIAVVSFNTVAQHKLDWRAMDASGAGKSVEGKRVLYSSFGQPSVGVSTSQSRVLNAGYLFVRVVPRGAPFLLTQASVNFGTVIVGDSSQQSLTLQNTGGTTLNIASISITPSQYNIAVGGGAQSLAAGGSVNLQLQFKPTAQGPVSGTLTVNSNASNGAAITVALSGQGTQTAQPRISLSASLIDFGSTAPGAAVTRDIIITNNGSANLLLTNQNINGAGFSLSTPSSSTIAPGGSGTATLNFNPSSDGLYVGSFAITNNDPNTPTVTVNLRGNAVTAGGPRIALSRTSIDFGNVAVMTSRDEDVVIRNVGASDLVIASQMIVGNDAQHYSIVASADQTIPPNGQSIARIRHLPLSDGSKTAFYRLQTNDPGASLVEIPLTSIVVAVEKLTRMPHGVMLHQNYPNPFSTQTTFTYEIEKEGNVQLDVFNFLGARVATLVDESHSPGVYRTGFEPMSLPAGIYTAVLRITSGQHVHTDSKVLTHIK